MLSPWVIAHRGAAGHAPENTLAAFERAVQLGAGFIETDLHLTRDARFVAIHDSTLERTTNGRGNVSDMTLAELRQLDAGQWYDRSYMGQRIPTLEEVLEFSRSHDVIFYLEMKSDVAWGMHQSLAGALREVQDAARTIVISFDPAHIEGLRRADPGLMTGLLSDEWDPDYVKRAIDVGARQVCPRAEILTPNLVRQAHASDLRVATWTVNSAEEIRRVLELGVDGVMSDFPDRVRAIAEDRACSSERP